MTAGRHTLIVDEPENMGGGDSGPTPQQLLAMSLASCTAITVEMYADRKQWDVGRLEVEVDYEPDAKGRCARFDVLLKLPAALSKRAGRADSRDRGQVPGAPHALRRRGDHRSRAADLSTSSEDCTSAPARRISSIARSPSPSFTFTARTASSTSTTSKPSRSASSTLFLTQ